MSFRKFVDRAENRNRADANRVNTYLRPVGIRNGLPDQVRIIEIIYKYYLIILVVVVVVVVLG